MRSQLFAAVSGALGLAALVAAAPAAYADGESCALSASTVFVTVSEAQTVTIHDSPTSYITVSLGELPTTTVTRLTTLISSTTTYVAPSTQTVSLSLVATASMKDRFSTASSSTYDYTVFETTIVTVTDSLAASETPASTDLLSFIVQNGTTYWLNGQTPPLTQSYAVETSVVTVMPVITPVTKWPSTSTETEHTTVVYTVPFTVSETLSASNSTSNTTSTLTASSFGTASSWAGWNATSSAAGVVSTGGYGQLTTISGAKVNNPYSTMSLITEESTLNIHHPITATYTAASYAAQSGFNALTSGPASVTSQLASKSFASDTTYLQSTWISASLNEPSQTASESFSSDTTYLKSTSISASLTEPGLTPSTSSALGAWTTAVINGQTVSWGGPANAVTSSSLSSIAPYPNATNSALQASVTSSILGTNTTCTEESSKTSMPYASNITSSLNPVITSLPVSLASSALSADTTSLGASTTCTEDQSQSMSHFVGNITSSLPMSTSSAIGVDTTSLGADTTCTENQSQTMSHSVGSIISSVPIFTSSAIGVDTTLSSMPTQTSSLPVSTTSAIGIATTSSGPLSSVTTASSSVLSFTDLGNITTFWTSQPMATLPTIYTTSISGSVIFTIHSESTNIPTSSESAIGTLLPTSSSSPSSGAAMTTLQSTLSESSAVSASAPLSTSSSVLTSSDSAFTARPSTLSSTSSVSVSAPLSSSSTLSSFSTTSPPSIASTNLSQTATSVIYSTSALPSLCGEYGDFTLNFDDIPPLAASNGTENTVAPQPVFSPYHQFDFSDGFVVVPPPTDPYKPSSGKLLTEFIPNFTLNTSTPESGPNSAEFGWSGDIGNADHGARGCFSFNVYGASFGCDSKGPDCMFSFTGFKYNTETKLPVQAISRITSIPACPALVDCDLVPITLDDGFKNLDVFRISLTVAGEPKIWWMDDLHMGWGDNACGKGLCRQGSKIRAVNQLKSR